MTDTPITDKFELYSFSIYLYFYAFFYMFIYNNTFFNGLLINLMGNYLFNYLFNYNILSFIGHNYWKYNLNTIAMPQLITCSTNIIILNHFYYFNNYNDFILILPFNYLLNYSIKKMYKNEINYSKNLRFVLIFLFLSYRILYYTF
jgi:hypothetical protein